MNTVKNFSSACRLAIFLLAIIALTSLTLTAVAANNPPYLPLNVHVGEKAPDFALPSANGGTVRLSQFAGHDVLLDFYEGYW